jgi:CHASE2 domain-containing sensor protein
MLRSLSMKKRWYRPQRGRTYLIGGIALSVGIVSISVIILIVATGFVTAIPALIGAILLDASLIGVWMRVAGGASAAPRADLEKLPDGTD